MRNLKVFYKAKFDEYGPTFRGSGWSENSKSKKRYKILINILKFKKMNRKISILDVGCGYGELTKYLPKNINYNYTGIDIVKSMIDYANKKNANKNMRFYLRDITKINKKYDFIICNGIFTLKNNLTDLKMKNFVLKCINSFYKCSNIAFAFNIMSEDVDFKSKILFYPKIKMFIDFFNKKKISKLVIDNSSVKYENFLFVKK